MKQSLYSSGVEWDRPRARHMWAAGSAVVLSVLLHGVAIQRFPPLPVGRLAGMDDDARIRPIVLGSVRADPPPSADRPDRFLARDPDRLVEATMEAAAFREIIESVLPSEPADMGVALAGEERALANVEIVSAFEPWDARQDIVRIRDRIVPDDMAFLPRRVVNDAERQSRAPDVTMPVDTPALSLAARGEAWMGEAAFDGGGLAGVGHGGVRGGRSPEEEEPAEPSALIKGVDALIEEDEERSDVAPIEQWLALQLHTFHQPDDAAYLYFEIRIRRHTPDVLPVLPKDILLIQDASASMTQRAIDQCKAGVHRWLDRLQDGDRFDVIAFRDDLTRAFDELVAVDPVTRSRAAFFVESLRARGGTDVFGSLQPLLTAEVDSERPLIAVLISDGVPTQGVMDSTAIIARFSEANSGQVSVFAVGGGSRVNRYLLDFLAYKNRGDAVMTAERADIPDALEQLAKEISRPVLTDLRWQVVGAADADMYPRWLTHLYLDRPLVMYGRVPRPVDQAVVQVVGRSNREVKDMVFALDFDGATQGTAEIRENWAWQKVYHLVGEHIRTGDPAYVDALHAIASEYGLNIAYGGRRGSFRF